MRIYIAFVLFLHLVVGMGLGYMVGENSQKKKDLEHCKQAAWEFIDNRIKIVGTDSNEFLQIYMSLRSAAATECIIRIDVN